MFDTFSRRAEALWKLALDKGPEKNVSKKWLLYNSSRLDREFIANHEYKVIEDGKYVRVEFRNEAFLWPAAMPIHQMLVFLSEQFSPNHPHCYTNGVTQVTSDDIVLDVGACEGVFTSYIAPKCKSILAVEPSKSMCALTEKQFALRQLPSPRIVQCLLGDKPSKAYFLENDINPGASHMSDKPVPGAYEVPIITLDELVQSTGIEPTFIKCDAEGAAMAIFSGGKNYLQRRRPKLAIASYHTESEYANLFNLLKPMGYQITGKGFLLVGRKLRVVMLQAYS
jgi:FkbM family methyltransferase